MRLQKILLIVTAFVTVIIFLEIFFYSTLLKIPKGLSNATVAPTAVPKSISAKSSLYTFVEKTERYLSDPKNSYKTMYSVIMYRGAIGMIEVDRAKSLATVQIINDEKKVIGTYRNFPIATFKRIPPASLTDLKQGDRVEVREFETVEVVGKKPELFIELHQQK